MTRPGFKCGDEGICGLSSTPLSNARSAAIGRVDVIKMHGLRNTVYRIPDTPHTVRRTTRLMIIYSILFRFLTIL
jgi:hypothetical protein